VDLGELTKRNQVFALAKARRRARVLTAWLTAVGILAIAALAEERSSAPTAHRSPAR
jgi:hypothetical protein